MAQAKTKAASQSIRGKKPADSKPSRRILKDLGEREAPKIKGGMSKPSSYKPPSAPGLPNQPIMPCV